MPGYIRKVYDHDLKLEYFFLFWTSVSIDYVLNNIAHFLQVLEGSLRNNALLTITVAHNTGISSNITNAPHFSTPPTSPMLVHNPTLNGTPHTLVRHPRNVTHVSTYL